jgi:hypothetical protein
MADATLRQHYSDRAGIRPYRITGKAECESATLTTASSRSRARDHLPLTGVAPASEFLTDIKNPVKPAGHP